MKLQLIAIAALAASGVANASLDNFGTGFNTGNSSLGFIAYDTIGADRSSAFIDLGLNVSDFIPETGALAGPNSSVVWNFANNTIVKNGVTVAATNNFSAFGSLLNAAQAADFRWGVIGGDKNIDLAHVWATGTPTSSQLNAQDASTTYTAVAVGHDMYNLLAPKLGTVDNGSYFAPSSTDSGFIANTAIFGTNWQQNLKWQTTTANNQTNFWVANGDDTETNVGNITDPDADYTGLLNKRGTFTLDRANQTLTWQTAAVAAVPEPGTYALFLGGLAVMGLVARRRNAK